MARAALSRRAIYGPNVSKLTVIYRPAGPTPVCRLSSRRATYGPYRPQLDGPFKRAKNGPSQMRKPGYGQVKNHDDRLGLALGHKLGTQISAPNHTRHFVKILCLRLRFSCLRLR